MGRRGVVGGVVVVKVELSRTASVLEGRDGAVGRKIHRIGRGGRNRPMLLVVVVMGDRQVGRWGGSQRAGGVVVAAGRGGRGVGGGRLLGRDGPGAFCTKQLSACFFFF